MSALPQGWVETTLGDLFNITSSKRVHQHEWTKEGVPFYRAREIKKLARAGTVENDLFISEELFEKFRSQFGAPVPGDLMVTAVGTLGECYQVREGDRFYFKDASVLWLRKQAGVEPGYVVKLFLSKSVLDQVHEGGGTTVGTYTVAAAKGTVVPLPPLSEQRRIVAKIDSLTGKSRRARDHLDHVPHLLEKYKQAVLAAAFTGDLTRTTTGTEPFVTSSPLSQAIASTFYGPRFAKDAYVSEGVVTLRTTDFDDRGNVVPKSPPRVRVSDREMEQWGLIEGDLLVTRTGSIGKCALYSQKIGPSLPSAYLIRVRLRTDIIVPRYALLFLQSPSGQDQLGMGVTAVTQPNINAGVIRNIKLPLPEIAHQCAVVRRIETAFSWIERLASEATCARRLIDRLDQAALAKAFRGELVPQDPAEEPAILMLERIKAKGGAAPMVTRGRRVKSA